MNGHPVVMFEVIAKAPEALRTFYTEVFGWQYEVRSDFGYVMFPGLQVATMGGIGQADPGVPGREAGRNFYLAVDDLPATLSAVTAAGGSIWVEPTTIDGFTFAMFKDPEGNVIGLHSMQ